MLGEGEPGRLRASLGDFMFRMFAGAAVGAFALSGLGAPAAEAANVRFSTGVDWTSGGYGQAKPTDVYVVPFSVKLYAGKWTFRASTSWLDVTGPADVAVIDDEGGGSDPGTVGTPGHHKRGRQGFGDSYLAAKYSFDHLGGGPAYVDVQGKVRLPTGSEDQGLGVGAVDYTVDAEFGADWRTKGLYVDIGRRFLGDNDHFVRQDGWAYSTGGWAVLDKKTELGMWYYTRDPSIAGFDRPREIGAYISRRLRNGWKAEVSLTEGLSDASPDVGAAFTLSYQPGWGHRRRR